MADVIFESERYEARRSRRRWLIPLLGVLGVIVIAVAAALILRAGKAAVVSDGEDTPYPYVWTTDRRGVTTLEIDCSAAPGYTWRLDRERPEITVAPAKQTEGKTGFTLTPAAEGRSLLRFVLQGAEASDRIYELSILTEVAAAKKTLQAVPVSIAGTPLQGIVRGGADSAFPYTIFTDEDGDLCVSVTVPELAAWDENTLMQRLEAEGITSDSTPEEIFEALDRIGWRQETEYDWDSDASDETVALALGVIEEENGIAAFFRAGETYGAATLRLFDSVSGACITMECENGAGGLLVTSHTETVG